MEFHQIIYQAIKNGSCRISGQFSDGETINIKNAVRLLENSINRKRHIAIRRNAKHLLTLMAKSKWKITAGFHRGGYPPEPDETNHFNIKIIASKETYHILVDARKYPFQIKGKGMEEIPPWIAPGAEY